MTIFSDVILNLFQDLVYKEIRFRLGGRNDKTLDVFKYDHFCDTITEIYEKEDVG
jgi:hypothetical protein